MVATTRLRITKDATNLAVLRIRGDAIPAARQLARSVLPMAYSTSKLRADAPLEIKPFIRTLDRAGISRITVPSDGNAEIINLGIRFGEKEDAGRLDLTNADTYKLSVLLLTALSLAQTFGWERASYLNTTDMNAEMQTSLLQYPNLGNLRLDLSGGEVEILPSAGMPSRNVGKGLYSLLYGETFTERAFAGEATRLKMGAKALLNPEALAVGAKANEIALTENHEDLLPLMLGQRQMVQFAYELMKLAKHMGLDPISVLNNQHMLITTNEQTYQNIIEMFIKNRYFLFDPEKVFFMVQRSFPGMAIEDGELFYDPNSKSRLHNHGSMAMQVAMENELFSIKPSSSGSSFDRVPVSSAEYEAILAGKKNRISYNVEDLSTLTGMIDLQALALAYDAGKKNYSMVMQY